MNTHPPIDVSYEAQQRWARTARGKVICPTCGHPGYLGGKWTAHHREHVTCDCGHIVTVKGLGAHRGSMKRHGRPCP